MGNSKIAIQQIDQDSIAILGMEETSAAFVDKTTFAKTYLEKEVESLGTELRLTAEDKILEAGAKRAFIPNGRRGGLDGVSTTLPNVTAAANRKHLKPELLKELITHEVSAALATTKDDLLEEEKEIGGLTVTLKGKWASWFKQNYIDNGAVNMNTKDNADYIQIDEVKPSIIHRLKPSAVAHLQGLLRAPQTAQQAKTLARRFLEAGVKQMSLRIETKK